MNVADLTPIREGEADSSAVESFCNDKLPRAKLSVQRQYAKYNEVSKDTLTSFEPVTQEHARSDWRTDQASESVLCLRAVLTV